MLLFNYWPTGFVISGVLQSTRLRYRSVFDSKSILYTNGTAHCAHGEVDSTETVDGKGEQLSSYLDNDSSNGANAQIN